MESDSDEEGELEEESDASEDRESDGEDATAPTENAAPEQAGVAVRVSCSVFDGTDKQIAGHLSKNTSQSFFPNEHEIAQRLGGVARHRRKAPPKLAILRKSIPSSSRARDRMGGAGEDIERLVDKKS